jgi:membrane-bound ClpP family serine protease
VLLRQLLVLCALLLVPLAAGQDAQPAAPAAPAAIPAGRQANKVAIITVDDQIDGIMARSIKRRIDKAAAAGYDAVVFDLNCPGGDVPSVLEVSNFIKSSPIQNTIAWVHPHAISGGAVIALACREIVIDDPCTFGDAMPITIGHKHGQWGVTVVDDEAFKKYMGPLVADLVESARRYNTTFGGYVRDEYLLEAIVANDVELWWVRNKDTGVKMAIDKEEFRMLFPGQPTTGPARLGPAGITKNSPPAPHGSNPTSAFPTDSNKLAGVAAEVQTILSGSTPKSDRPRLTDADVGRWELLDKVNDGSLALTFKPDDMVYFGLCANETQTVGSKTVVKPIRTDADVMAFVGAKSYARADVSWSEYMAGFLGNFVVKGVLIVIFLIALFIEMTHPGTIVPGCVALLALVLLVGPSLLEGMSGWWEVLAILVGLVLLGLEAFVIPGFGVAGVLGLILLFAGLVGTFVPSGGSFSSPQSQSDMLWGATTVLLAGATAGFGMWMVAKHFGSIPVLGRLVLKDPNLDEESEAILAAMDPDPDAEVRPGEIGTALTPLRPAGRVDMGDRVVDAISEFGFIPAGAKVRIVSASAMRIGVEQVTEKS